MQKGKGVPELYKIGGRLCPSLMPTSSTIHSVLAYSFPICHHNLFACVPHAWGLQQYMKVIILIGIDTYIVRVVYNSICTYVYS